MILLVHQVLIKLLFFFFSIFQGNDLLQLKLSNVS